MSYKLRAAFVGAALSITPLIGCSETTEDTVTSVKILPSIVTLTAENGGT